MTGAELAATLSDLDRYFGDTDTIRGGNEWWRPDIGYFVATVKDGGVRVRPVKRKDGRSK